MKTDWFELQRGAPAPAPLHRAAFPDRGRQRDHAVGRAGGRQVRRRHAVARRRPAGRAAKLADILAAWREAEAAKYGKTFNRDDWRLVVNMHCAEDDERALRDVARGERHRDADLLLRDARPPADAQRESAGAKGWRPAPRWWARPETIIKGIERLLGYTEGGAGGGAVPRATNGPTARTPCAATSCSPAG